MASNLNMLLVRGAPNMTAKELEAWALANPNDEAVQLAAATAPKLGKNLARNLLTSSFWRVRARIMETDVLEEAELLPAILAETSEEARDAGLGRLSQSESWQQIMAEPRLALPVLGILARSVDWNEKAGPEVYAWAVNTVTGQDMDSAEFNSFEQVFYELDLEVRARVSVSRLAAFLLKQYQQAGLMPYYANKWPELVLELAGQANPQNLPSDYLTSLAKQVSTITSVSGSDLRKRIDQTLKVAAATWPLGPSQEEEEQGRTAMLEWLETQAGPSTPVEQLQNAIVVVGHTSFWDSVRKNPAFSVNWAVGPGFDLAARAGGPSFWARSWAMELAKDPGLLEQAFAPRNGLDDLAQGPVISGLANTWNILNPRAFGIETETFDTDWQILLRQGARLHARGNLPPFSLEDLMDTTWVQTHPQLVPLNLVGQSKDFGAGCGRWLAGQLMELAKTSGPQVYATAEQFSTTLDPTTTGQDLVQAVGDFLSNTRRIPAPVRRARKPKGRSA